MAITSSINLDKVSGSVKSLNTGIGQLKKSADTIKTVSLNKIKVKRESIVRDKILSNMREEQVKRRDQESVIEASGIGGAFKRVTSVIGDSTKGFLDRIINFASSILIGWLLYNLPTIITGIEDLITRIKSLYGILTGFVSNITNTFQNFGTLLSAVYQDITHFDFTDQSKRVQNAMDDLNVNLDLMHDQFMEGFDLLKTPLGEGPGEEPIPALNTDYTQPAPTTGTPSSSTIGGQDLYTLATIAGLESGYAQGQADVAQSIYNRMKKSGKGVVDVVTSPTQYEPFFGKGPKGIDPESKNIRTFDDAVKYRMKKTGENRAAAERSVLSIISAIQDPSKQASAREFVGTRTSFRGSPQNTGNNLRNVTWRGSRSDNQFLNEQVVSGTPATVPSFVSSPTKTTQVPSQSSLVQGGKIIEYLTGDRKHKRYRADHAAGNYHDHFAFNNQATRDAAIKWLRSKGWVIGSINTGKHANDSYHYSNQAFDIPFYPNQSKKGVSDDAKGETILSSRVRADLIAGGFNGSQLGRSSISPPSQPAQVSSTKPAQLSPRVFQVQTPETQPAQLSSMTTPGQNFPAITQDRKGRQTVVIEDRQQSAPQQVFVGGGSQIQMMPIEDSLNSMIKNQILLELAYT